MATPTNSVTKAMQNAKAALCATIAFRTWTGSTPQSAPSRVHKYGYSIAPSNGRTYTKAELKAMRPCVVMDLPPEAAVSRQSIAQDAGSYAYESEGAITLMFEQDIPAEIATNHGEAVERFLNSVIDIMEEWETLNPGIASTLLMEAWTLEWWGRVETDEAISLGDYFMAAIRVRWGGP